MHTNFDVWVMARLAADRMGLEDREVLEVTGMDNDGIREVPVGIGCTGYLEKSMTLEACARAVKRPSVFQVSVISGTTPKLSGKFPSVLDQERAWRRWQSVRGTGAYNRRYRTP